MATVYLSLGSNLGDRLRMLRHAVAALAQVGEVRAVSSVYETLPWGLTEQPRFLNACCALETDLEPGALLNACQEIERELGRKPTERWGPRAIDLDILLHNHDVLDTPHLTVPHPRLAERAFVLVPLGEIAADLVIPGLRATVRALLAKLPNAGQEVQLAEPPTALYLATSSFRHIRLESSQRMDEKRVDARADLSDDPTVPEAHSAS